MENQSPFLFWNKYFQSRNQSTNEISIKILPDNVFIRAVSCNQFLAIVIVAYHGETDMFVGVCLYSKP